MYNDNEFMTLSDDASAAVVGGGWKDLLRDLMGVLGPIVIKEIVSDWQEFTKGLATGYENATA